MTLMYSLDEVTGGAIVAEVWLPDTVTERTSCRFSRLVSLVSIVAQ